MLILRVRFRWDERGCLPRGEYAGNNHVKWQGPARRRTVSYVTVRSPRECPLAREIERLPFIWTMHLRASPLILIQVSLRIGKRTLCTYNEEGCASARQRRIKNDGLFFGAPSCRSCLEPAQ